jgi:hypothetical protein
MSLSEITPLEEKIRRRAHELYLQRLEKGLQRDALGDWLEAEAEIKGEGKSNGPVQHP